MGKLIAASAVEEVDRELYFYGFFLLITRFFFFLVTVAIGFFLRIPCESVFFYIAFILLRSYAGGVHAKTESACTVLTALTLGFSVFAIKILEFSNSGVISLLITVNMSIFLFSPLDTPKKPLDAAERGRYRRICCRLLVVCNLIMFLFAVMEFWRLCRLVLYGMCLETVLLGIGKCVVKLGNLRAVKKGKRM